MKFIDVDGATGPGVAVSRVRARDPVAWEELFRTVYPAMLAYANRRLPHREDARDAVSDALARAVAGIDRLPDEVSPTAWLFGILRHVVLDVHRRRYRRRQRPAVADPAEGQDPAEDLERHDEYDLLRRAFRSLRPKEQDLLELRVVAGLSAEEVGRVLQMRPGAVRMAQNRALDRLRRALAELDPVSGQTGERR